MIPKLPTSELARSLGVSEAAVDLVRASEVVDLHVEPFLMTRLLGYDLRRRHGTGPTGGRLGGHLDLPRARAGGLTGAMWSVSTNPARSAAGRFRAWRKNAQRLRALLEGGGEAELVRSHGEWQAARARGKHAALLSIQGGNALDAAPEGDLGDEALVRVTLVHLTSSRVGDTSSPLGRSGRGLTPQGRELVRRLDAARVFVDLAHIDRQGFWDAVAVHDRARPLIVTHTGVSAVRPHWRNLDDAQLRAVAESGGVVGIMFHTGFLSRPGGPRDAGMVAEHLEHVVRTVGADHVAIGSDYDGMIVPPPELRSGEAAYLRLAELLLRRGWPELQVQKALGASFLRVLAELRP